MKHIVAFIKPNMLEGVVFALHKIEYFPGATITEVKGIGGGLQDSTEKGNHTPLHSFPKSVRLEIVCKDEQVEPIVTAIEKHAHTGLPGDGKIYVSNVGQAVRIRTGQRGNDAV